MTPNKPSGRLIVSLYQVRALFIYLRPFLRSQIVLDLSQNHQI